MIITLRSYQESDRERCRGLWRELVEWHRKIYSNPLIGGDRPEDYFDKHLSLVGKQSLWVAEFDSKIVGFIGLVFKENEAEIEPIVVAKGYRHKGIGRQLVEQVISEAKKRKVTYLNVSPVARNKETIMFFYKLGFVNVGHVNLFIDFTGRTWKSGFQMHDLNFNY
jgi:GNAT superfamily N-acetyltransferase